MGLPKLSKLPEPGVVRFQHDHFVAKGVKRCRSIEPLHIVLWVWLAMRHPPGCGPGMSSLAVVRHVLHWQLS